MNKKITTLEELQAERKKLKMQMEVSKREFFHSFDATRTQAKDLLFKKVAIPAGTLGLVALGLKQFTGSSENNNENARSAQKTSNSFLVKIMPVVLPLIRAYFSSEERLNTLPPFLQELIAPEKNSTNTFTSETATTYATNDVH